MHHEWCETLQFVVKPQSASLLTMTPGYDCAEHGLCFINRVSSVNTRAADKVRNKTVVRRKVGQMRMRGRDRHLTILD